MVLIWGITEESQIDLCGTSIGNGMGTCTLSLNFNIEVVCADIEWYH